MAGQPHAPRASLRDVFDLDERYRALSKRGDPLERFSAVVDFEIFRPVLDAALARSDRSQGGRPPMDAVMMFKVLVIQALYGLADERTEFRFAALRVRSATGCRSCVFLGSTCTAGCRMRVRSGCFGNG